MTHTHGMDRVRLNTPELRVLLKCPRCLCSPMKTPIYMCSLGHSVCCTCCEQLRKEAPEGGAMCVICHNKMTTIRNLIAENLVKQLGRVVGTKSNMHIVREQGRVRAVLGDDKRPLFIVNSLEALGGGHTDECGEGSSQSYQNDRGQEPSVVHERVPKSHRPIKCPNAPCTSTVAVAALTAHFSFDHPDVPLLSVDPGVPSHLWIAPESIPLEMPRCLALLLLSGQTRNHARCMSLANLSRSMAKYVNRAPLPLMATRSRIIGDRTLCWNEANCSVSDADASSDEDCILLWACDVDSDLLYTIQVSQPKVDDKSMDTPRCLMAINPVASLRESQTPLNVYRRGDAIIITPAFLRHVTKESGGFDITVMINVDNT